MFASSSAAAQVDGPIRRQTWRPRLDYSGYPRVDRLIAAGRAALASFSVLAVVAQPGPAAADVLMLLFGYLMYAVLIVALLSIARIRFARFALATHVIDVVMASALVQVTNGPSSSFFSYLIFVILCGTLKWQWRGTLLTAAAVLVVFVTLGVAEGPLGTGVHHELTHFVVRCAALLVVAILLGYMGAHQQRVTADVTRLASWPIRWREDACLLTDQVLQEVAAVLGVSRAVLVFEPQDEPWLTITMFEHGVVRTERQEGGLLASIVPAALHDQDYLCDDCTVEHAVVLQAEGDGLMRVSVPPLTKPMLDRLRPRTLLSWHLEGNEWAGRLMVLDKAGASVDDLLLGQIAARLVAARIDHQLLLGRLQDAAVADERTRLARDLHDGLLQTLTGVALQVESADRLLERDVEAGRARLREIQRGIAAEQRDLRVLIGQLRPGAARGAESQADIAPEIADICSRVERQWGIRVDLTLADPLLRLRSTVATQVFRIVQESLVNAARHANATLVSVGVRATAQRLEITVADNGRGFPFQGRYDIRELERLEAGPRSLRERIAALGGSMVIDSSAAGATLRIELPLGI